MEPLDRLAVEGLGVVALVQQRSCACLDPEGPVGAAGVGDLGELGHRCLGPLGSAAPHGRLDQLRGDPRREAELVGPPGEALGGCQGFVVATEAVVQQRAGPLGHDQPEPFAATVGIRGARVDEGRGLVLVAGVRGHEQRRVRAIALPQVIPMRPPVKQDWRALASKFTYRSLPI